MAEPDLGENNLLLVEDDELDVIAIKRALRKANIGNPLFHASDGVEALAMLRGESGPPIARPYMILLDLNMPRMDGIEFLAEIRSDPDLKDSIVFMLTTSNDAKDISRAYENMVAGYMVKSKAGEDFLNLVRMLDHYWHIIEFPVSRPSSDSMRPIA